MTPNPAQQAWSPPGKDSLSDPGSRVSGVLLPEFSISLPGQELEFTKAQVLYCQKDTRRDAAGDEKQSSEHLSERRLRGNVYQKCLRGGSGEPTGGKWQGRLGV